MNDSASSPHPSEVPSAPSKSIYDALAEPFAETYTRNVSGTALTYITGEQAVSRLNSILGFDGWSFRVLEHGFNEEADEIWVLGELEVHYGQDHPVLRQQFGSQKVNRARTDRHIIDTGFDLKAATTDCLKKAASLIGVGLYLSKKEESASSSSEGQAFAAAHQQRAAEERSTPAKSAPAKNTATAPGADLVCADCGNPLEEIRFKDGAVWTPAQLAAYGRRKFNRVLDISCYRKAGQEAKAAEAAGTVPF